MTRREAQRQIQTTATEIYGADEAKAISLLLCRHFFGFDRIDLAVSPDREISDTAILDFITDKIRQNIPVQYITGQTEFYGRVFRVGPESLIPRPETEELVRWVLSSTPPESVVLDIGTGSGAIVVTIAAERPDSTVWAADISGNAIEMATQNARCHDSDVRFVRMDVLADRSKWDVEWPDSSFDVIVSNPPYIPSSEKSGMRANVTEHEPHLALFVPDDDPLVFYRTIAFHALSLLKQGGWLYFEIHENYGEEIVWMLDSMGFTRTEIRKDLNDKPRMVRCRKN